MDPRIKKALEDETKRQQNNIELIASEKYPSFTREYFYK